MPDIFANLRGLLNRSVQTRIAADSPAKIRNARQSGTAAAYRRAISLLVMVQLILWAALPGVAVAGRGVWLAALGLIPAAVGVWMISKLVWCQQENAPRRGAAQSPHSSGARPWELLALLPCVLLDTLWLTHTLLSVLHRLMPSYPAGILRVVMPLLLVLAVLLGKRNGAAYGVSLWRWVLPVLAVWVLAQVVGHQGMDQLYPLLGRGWKATAQGMLPGLGGLWCIGLLFLLPECDRQGISLRRGKPARTVVYVLLPLGLGVLMAVGVACCASWQALGTAGLRLLWLGRSGGMMLAGLWSLTCLLGLMTGICTSLMAAQKLTQRVWPRCPGWLPVLAAAVPASVLLWVWSEQLPAWVMALLPWRLGLWGVSAAMAGVRRWKRR